MSLTPKAITFDCADAIVVSSFWSVRSGPLCWTGRLIPSPWPRRRSSPRLEWGTHRKSVTCLSRCQKPRWRKIVCILTLIRPTWLPKLLGLLRLERPISTTRPSSECSGPPWPTPKVTSSASAPRTTNPRTTNPRTTNPRTTNPRTTNPPNH
jgi:hypothetical protein